MSAPRCEETVEVQHDNGYGNNGVGQLEWLSFNPQSGTVAPEGNVDVQCQFDATDLDLGDYQAQVMVQNNAGEGVTVLVNLVVIAEDDIPNNISLSNLLIAFDETHCFDVLQNITISDLTIQEGSSVELIAGESIHFLPGTVVEQGGYLLARIALSAYDYCGIPVAVELKDGLTRQQEHIQYSELRVDCGKTPESRLYPNPTRGDFTLELNPPAINDLTVIEVYSIHGKLIKRMSLCRIWYATFDRQTQCKSHLPCP